MMSERPLGPIPVEVSLRRATSDDAPVLGAMRAALRAESSAHEAAAIDAFARSCEAYFARELGRAQTILRAWLACEGQRVIGTAVLMMVPTLPRLGSEGTVDGRVRDLYVMPTHRRRGVARALMAAVLSEAGALRIDRLSLGTSVMGRPLYESLGFVTKRDEMVYEPPTH